MNRRTALLSLSSAALLPVVGGTAAAQTPEPAPAGEPVPVSLRTVPLQARDVGPERSVTSEQPFSMVGLTWEGPAPEVMELRVRQGSGWSEWVAVGVAEGAETALGASAPVWTGYSRELEVRALRAGAPAPDVSAVLLDPGTSPADLQAPPLGREGSVPVISRAGWGADESLRCMAAQYDDTVLGITLHHTAESNNYRPEDSARIVRGIYAYHAQTLGWCDIGYHALVDKYGQVFEGRAGGLDRPVIGAHAGGFNRRTSSIAMMGLYTGEEPSEPMVDALVRWLDWKADVSRLNPNGQATLVSEGGGTSRHPAGTVVRVPTIFGHRDVGTTECPGDDGYALLPFIRSAIAATPAAPVLTG